MIVELSNKHPDYPDLTTGQPYFVIGIEADALRILNNSGKPYLYPAKLFTTIDSHEPKDWVTEYGDDGERYAYPTQLNQPGFFEDLFDRKPEQTAIFWHTVNQRLSQAA